MIHWQDNGINRLSAALAEDKQPDQSVQQAIPEGFVAGMMLIWLIRLSRKVASFCRGGGMRRLEGRVIKLTKSVNDTWWIAKKCLHLQTV